MYFPDVFYVFSLSIQGYQKIKSRAPIIIIVRNSEEKIMSENTTRTFLVLGYIILISTLFFMVDGLPVATKNGNNTKMKYLQNWAQMWIIDIFAISIVR